MLLEIRKIVTWKKLLLLAGFTFLYLLMFVRPYLRFTGGSYHMEADLAASFIGQYGYDLSEEEFSSLRKQRPVPQENKVDTFIANDPEYTAYGICSLEELLAQSGSSGLSLEVTNWLWFHLYDSVSAEEVTSLMEELIIFHLWDSYITSYERETAPGTAYYEEPDAHMRARIAERDLKEVYGLTSPVVTECNFTLLRFFSAFMMISAPVFIMPYMVAENRSRMPALQYSFTYGRKYYRKRIRAVILAALGVLLAETCIYGLCAKTDRVFTLWDCTLSGFASGFIGWFPWTIGSYTVCCLILSAITAIGLTLISFVITSHLSNYVSAIAWQLPLTVFGGAFGGFVMYRFGEITEPRFLTVTVCAVVFTAGLLAAVIQGKGEKRKDA